MRRRGIKFHLLVLVALIIFPFAALLGFILDQRMEMRRHHALQTEMEVARGLAVTFSAYLEGLRKQDLAIGHAIISMGATNRQSSENLLKRTLADAPNIVATSWISPSGVVLSSSAPGFIGRDCSTEPFLAEVRGGRALFIANVMPRGQVSPHASVAIATAIRDQGGRLEGVVLSEVDPARFGSVLQMPKREDEGAFALFDHEGTVVYHSRYPSLDWTARGYWRRSSPAIVEAAKTGSAEGGIRRAALKGGDAERVFAAVPIPGTGWVAEASRPTSVAFADARRGTIKDSLLGAGVFALAFLLAYLLGRNIVAPLRRLESEARLMGSGKEASWDDPAAPAEVASLRATMLVMANNLIRRGDVLRESEALLQTIFDNVYDGVLIHTIDGRIVQVNERWSKIFRVTREEANRLTISEISANPPPLEELVALWRQVLQGETMLFEWNSRRPGDGSLFDAEVFICPIRFKGEGMIMACVRDITERKQAARELQQYRDELELRVRERTEELARAVEEIHQESEQRIAAVEELRRKDQLLIHQSRLAAMGEMLGNIAHQWRQPLNVLALLIQELKLSYQKGLFSEELLLEAVGKAMKIISHMSQTIDDFRYLLSPDKARHTFSVNEVVEKVLSFMQMQARVEIEAEESCLAEGSRNEFSQVIINIIANAHDVFRERQIEDATITIRIFRDQGRSVVTIADNGGGIDPEVIDRVFDPYFTTKGPEKGTGLGLFMSKTIIEQSMMGALTVRNTASGAEFRIEV